MAIIQLPCAEVRAVKVYYVCRLGDNPRGGTPRWLAEQPLKVPPALEYVHQHQSEPAGAENVLQELAAALPHLALDSGNVDQNEPTIFSVQQNDVGEAA